MHGVNGKLMEKPHTSDEKTTQRLQTDMYECQTPNVRPKSERKVASVKS